MPDLRHTLVNYDPGLLMIIAKKWDLVLAGTTQVDIVEEMVHWIVDTGSFETVLEKITDEQKDCLITLASNDGKLPWNTFTRRYGSIREMGIARRDRDMPYHNTISVTESLWYYGLIGRAFLNINDTLLEYAYIPDEFRTYIAGKKGLALCATDSVALRHEYRVVFPADDRVLDHLTSYLAAIRSGRDLEILKSEFKQPSIQECQAVLICTGLIELNGLLKPEAVKTFLARPRHEALLMICMGWLNSTDFNELRLMPGILCEGVWNNDPLKTRQVLVGQLRSLVGERWWSINGFIAQIKQNQPDYQRPAGEYESWIIRSVNTGASLRGYQHWDEIDGALIRYLVTGPMHWLGFTDLGSSRRGGQPETFRFSKMADSLFSGLVPEGLHEEKGVLTVLRSGQITCSRYMPRAARYQLARFCEWLGVSDKGYLYQLSLESIQKAIRQGLQIEQLLGLLSRHASSSLPKSLVIALQRLAKSGIQMSINRMIVLQVPNKDDLTEIRTSPVGRFLGEVLNPTTVKISPAAAEKIMARLLELGYFCEMEDSVLSIDTNKD